jgi:hypothetical protein
MNELEINILNEINQTQKTRITCFLSYVRKKRHESRGEMTREEEAYQGRRNKG